MRSGCCCCCARRCFCLADCRHIVIISVQASIFERRRDAPWFLAYRSKCDDRRERLEVKTATSVWRRGGLQVWQRSSEATQAGTRMSGATLWWAAPPRCQPLLLEALWLARLSSLCIWSKLLTSSAPKHLVFTSLSGRTRCVYWNNRNNPYSWIAEAIISQV